MERLPSGPPGRLDDPMAGPALAVSLDRPAEALVPAGRRRATRGAGGPNREIVNRPLIRPARHLSQPPVHAPNAALLIDFDNVTMGIRSDLTKELRTLLNSDIIKGKVAVQRAYADWRRYPQYIVPLSESSIDLIFAPAFGSTKKNATDIRLAIDAIELVFTRPEIGTFILLSGDSDFSSMVIKLKEYGKYVIGVGIRESSSDLLVQNCDEYYSYNELAGLTKEVETPSSQRDPWELVARGRRADGPQRRRDALRPAQAGDAADRSQLRRAERRLQSVQQVRARGGPEGRRARHQAGQRAVRGRAGSVRRGRATPARGPGSGRSRRPRGQGAGPGRRGQRPAGAAARESAIVDASVRRPEIDAGTARASAVR